MQVSLLLDSAVAAHALGDESQYRDACRSIIAAAAADRIRAYASVEMIQELVHHRLRRTGDRRLAAADGHSFSAILTVLNFDREVLDLSLDLVERAAIRGRDAVHAATALAYGIDTIVSPDRAFDGITGITRVDPTDLAASLASPRP